MNENAGNCRAKKINGGEIFLPSNLSQPNVAMYTENQIIPKYSKEQLLPPNVDKKSIEFPEFYPHYLLKGFTEPVFEKNLRMYTCKGIADRYGQKVGYIPLSAIDISKPFYKLRSNKDGRVPQLVRECLDNAYKFIKEQSIKGFWINLSYPSIDDKTNSIKFLDPNIIKETTKSEQYPKLWFTEERCDLVEKIASKFDEANNSCLLSEVQYVCALIYGIQTLEYQVLYTDSYLYSNEYAEVNTDYYDEETFVQFFVTSKYLRDGGYAHYRVFNIETKQIQDCFIGLYMNPSNIPHIENRNDANFEENKHFDEHHIINHPTFYSVGVPIKGRIPIVVKSNHFKYKIMRPLGTGPSSKPYYAFYGVENSKYPKSFLLGYKDF